LNPRDLLAALETLADAPQGITQIRDLVLNLAVRGQLVPHDPAAQPATDLLDQCARKRSLLVEQGLLKKKKSPSIVHPLDEPFEVPASWLWIRAGALGELIRGVTYAKAVSSTEPFGQSLPLLRANNIRSSINYEGLVYVPSALVSEVQRLTPGDFLICMSSGSKNLVGKSAVVTGDVEASFGAFCSVYRPLASQAGPYLNRFFQSPLYREAISATSRGIGINNLRKGDIEELPLPLPPLAEQLRIVARVDELMALLDRLEAAKEARDATRAQLRDAALAALQDANDAEEVKTAWSRIADNMHDLFTDPADIPPLRQTVLQLAAQGLLVAHDPADDSAIEIVKGVAQEKARLVKEKKLRKSKPLAPISDAQRLFEVPQSWAWVRADDLCLQITDGTHHTPTYVDEGVAFLSVKDISTGRINFSNCRYIAEKEHAALCKRCQPELGDVLLTKVGTTGIAVEVDTDREFSIFVSVALLKLLPNTVFPRFLVHLLNSPLVKLQSAEGTEGVGNKNLVLRKIRAFTMPLAPYAEQCRIVEKVDELMALLDRLESALDSCRKIQEAFCGSAVRALPGEPLGVRQDSAMAVG